MRAMNKTRRLLGDKGANFINAFVTTPLCCPSRSSILTGQYVHNHGVYSNQDHCVSEEWRAGPERRSFGAFLQNANYRTGKNCAVFISLHHNYNTALGMVQAKCPAQLCDLNKQNFSPSSK